MAESLTNGPISVLLRLRRRLGGRQHAKQLLGAPKPEAAWKKYGRGRGLEEAEYKQAKLRKARESIERPKSSGVMGIVKGWIGVDENFYDWRACVDVCVKAQTVSKSSMDYTKSTNCIAGSDIQSLINVQQNHGTGANILAESKRRSFLPQHWNETLGILQYSSRGSEEAQQVTATVSHRRGLGQAYDLPRRRDRCKWEHSYKSTAREVDNSCLTSVSGEYIKRKTKLTRHLCDEKTD
ncbi:hypothetical protein BDY17DRAFT_313170 [Neohortaea acidophila]|uniref:Uncharacterized protein n=1 Tax=Neohortaea acidophila TaxID=245834 RepID=A0A6A6PK04_9PEZI|nr:uncharacterized protein BDY17DRAFT_313170 [Neohortaea acidophila]KAF2480332.1 hypothetical protein BDY17DRAFT_313170 [Neohortaea acidophila]